MVMMELEEKTVEVEKSFPDGKVVKYVELGGL